MPSYHGIRVSASHLKLLTAYEKKYGVAVALNSGQRTKADQEEMIREKGVYNSQTNPHGAARYSTNAPHVKTGHEHHALDISHGSGKGRSDHVAEFYRDNGVEIAFNVSTENWHMDTTDEQSLIRAAKKISVDPSLRFHSAGPSVVKLKKLLYAAGIRNFSSTKFGAPSSNRYSPFFGKNTLKAVQRFQRAHGLNADGVAGPSTWHALRRAGK